MIAENAGEFVFESRDLFGDRDAAFELVNGRCGHWLDDYRIWDRRARLGRVISGVFCVIVCRVRRIGRCEFRGVVIKCTVAVEPACFLGSCFGFYTVGATCVLPSVVEFHDHK